MEYIISSSQAPSGNIYEDETYCSRGLCQHPSCWESHVRTSRGFRKYISLSADTPMLTNQHQSKDEDDEGLPTMKVLNMLDDYGESPTDMYPSSRKGRPAHQQHATKATKQWRNKTSLGNMATPRTSPASSKTKLIQDILEPSRKEATIKQVEVQEVFDLEELNQTWDNTFLTKPMYVWIPGKQKRKQKKKSAKSSADQDLRPLDTVAMKDVTNEMLPRQPYIAPPTLGDPSRQTTIPRSRSPLPTGGQPYSNVGQTPKDRMRFRVIMNELKDLPRPFVLEVLEKARGLDNKEDVLMLMERYLKTMRKSDWELSMVTGKVLQQQRMDSKMFGVTERLHHVSTNQVYKLDEVEDGENSAHSSIPADVMEASIYNSARYKPLPDIARKKKNSVRMHVSTTTQDSVKPFQYKKQSDMEFCLGPARSLSTLVSRPQSDDRTSVSARGPNDPAADMSVLYDQESVDRNRNVNNNARALRMDGDAGPNDSRTSSTIPKAPAGTPYTPKTPYKDKNVNLEKNTAKDIANSSADGFVLEVIQEMTVVDEFATDNNRKHSIDPNLTTKSVIETRSLESPIKRRVVSATLPRMEAEPTGARKARSVDLSLAVEDNSTVGDTDQVFDTLPPGQVNRVTTSRLEVVSTTSNWPNVDEEALLREQTTPKPEPARVVSAPDKGLSKDRHRRPATQPMSAKEKEPQKTSIVVDLPPVTMDENSPAPPPPSPEPDNKVPQSKLPTNDSDLPAATVIDLSDLTDLPPAADHNDSVMQTCNQSQSALQGCDESGKDKEGAEHKTSGSPTKEVIQSDIAKHSLTQSDAAESEVNQSQSKYEEMERELDEKMELRMNVHLGTADPLSMIPDKLYQELDMERDISLSAMPPSTLDTPEFASVYTRPKETDDDDVLPAVPSSTPTTLLNEPAAYTAIVSTSHTPTLVMMQEDQGGLSGQ